MESQYLTISGRLPEPRRAIMANSETTTHKLDHETYGVGAVILLLGVVLGPVGAVWRPKCLR